jgi:iron only hydrogenase large subunit-like protein
MPCFDKKLEASRESYQLNPEVKEVDTVIASTELIELLEKHKFSDMKVDNQRIIFNFENFMLKALNCKDKIELSQFKESYKISNDVYNHLSRN